MVKDEYFNNIKEMYDSFYKFLLVNHGKYPVKDTEVGYWGISVADEVYELFNRINLSRYNHFLDLGSGDGKVAMIASLFTKSTGVEYDPWLVEVSNDIKNKLYHIPHLNNVTFINKDFMGHDLTEHDIVFWNPDKNTTELNEKFLKELNGTLILHGPHNHPDNFRKVSTHDINGTLMTIYRK